MTDKFEFIDSCRDESGKYAYPVRKMCAWLSVSPSWFFDWRKKPISAAAERRQVLAGLVSEVIRVAARQ